MTTTQHIERLDRERRRLLLVILIVFNLWQIPSIFLDAFDGQMPRLALVLLTTVGAIAFTYTMLRWHFLKKGICADPELASTIDDERVKSLWLSASQKGWVALILWLAVFRAIGAFHDLPMGLVLQSGIVIGISIPIISFLYLDREKSDAAS